MQNVHLKKIAKVRLMTSEKETHIKKKDSLVNTVAPVKQMPLRYSNFRSGVVLLTYPFQCQKQEKKICFV